MAGDSLSELLSIEDISLPRILVSERDFLVAYKPPRFHSAPLACSRNENLLDWCAGRFPEVKDLPGRQKGEGGLIHRLDYETGGLILIARTGEGMEALLEQQREGKIIKEYDAAAKAGGAGLPGFPPEKPGLPREGFAPPAPNARIASAFRPYGRGRKAVRPVLFDGVKSKKPGGKAGEIAADNGKPYVTEILENAPGPGGIVFFRLRIAKGFRHQIRCHLAWAGFPILNDEAYGGDSAPGGNPASGGRGFLALRAASVSFGDPSAAGEQGIRRISYVLTTGKNTRPNGEFDIPGERFSLPGF